MIKLPIGDFEFGIGVFKIHKIPNPENTNPLFADMCLTHRAPERWERWEQIPSQFEILTATFG